MPTRIIQVIDEEELSVPIKIDGTEYDVLQEPGPQSPLVQDARRAILNSIDLKDLLQQLGTVDGLLLLARAAIVGNDTQGKHLDQRATKLHQDFRPVCIDAADTMLSFSDGASAVLEHLLGAFNHLYGGREDQALPRLARCAEFARTMAGSAAKLEARFQSMETEAGALNVDVHDARSMEDTERQRLKLEKEAFEQRKARAEEIRTQLEKQIPNLQALYTEEKEAEKDAENKEHAENLVSSIFGAVSNAVASGVSLYAGMAGGGAEMGAMRRMAGGSGGVRKSLRTLDGNAEDDSDTREVLNTLKTVRSEQTLDDLDPDDDGVDATDLSGLEPLDGLLDKTPVDSYRNAADHAFAGIAAVPGSPLDDAGASGGGTDKSAGHESDGTEKQTRTETTKDSAGEKASARHARVRRELLQEILKLQGLEREALADIREFAMKIASAQEGSDRAALAVAALSQAGKALSASIVVLQNARRFWTRMAEQCARLAADSDLRSRVESAMKCSAAERFKEWTQASTCKGFLSLTARWVALREIADEYHKAAEAVVTDVGQSIKRDPNPQEAPALAKQLADRLLVTVAQQSAAVAQKEAQTRAEIKQAEAVAGA